MTKNVTKEYYLLEDFKNDPQLFKQIGERELITFKCQRCDNIFKRVKRGIQPPNKMKEKGYYCSRNCASLNEGYVSIVTCRNCNKTFKKRAFQIKKTNENNFCRKSCAATYNNKYKKRGTRRSKLEVWLEDKLQEKFDNILFDFNKKNVINSELDIYCPNLNIAFELNGIFHYKPIYGEKKFLQIQNNDKEKEEACRNASIELFVIDVSYIKYFSEKSSIIVLNQVSAIIESRIR